ncbi:MAG: hypothetical protein HC837_19615 [Chloroflexaceae bacterium]|nr:hypothetical protein [Chloroflexaceae bacterium]
MMIQRPLTLIGLFLFLVCGLHTTTPTNARSQLPDTPSPGVQLKTAADRIELLWQAPAGPVLSQTMDLPDLAPTIIGDMELPAHLLAIHLTDPADFSIQINHIETQPWPATAALTPVTTAVPQLVDGDLRPDLAHTPENSLPTTPLIVLRQGMLRGEPLVVVALSPIFAHEQGTQLATRIEARISGGRLLAPDASSLLQQMASTPPFLSNASGPTNPFAATAAIKLRVDQAGMQTVRGDALANAGLALDSLDPTRLQLWQQGTPIALELLGTDDGRLDAMILYASTPRRPATAGTPPTPTGW